MLFFEDEELLINKLFISDELYIMSPYLNLLFKSYFAKELILKKIKINSKLQLSNFFNFIVKNNECEKLILEDISIELILKRGEDDNSYNELNQYFYYSKGRILIKNMENNNIKIKKLKLIDCPLFALTDDIFFEINKFKEISINIDSNSLLNPEMITKFKINEGLIDICYDLDSYKVNNEEEEDKDYLEHIKYIFEIILENINNYRKIKFKNFDITKFEYVTGENYTNIDESDWVLNEEENNKKIKYENFYKTIKEKIKKSQFKNIKELVFDNCTNNFMELILSMINNDLDLFKLKKCAKDFFKIEIIKNIYIKHLFLFDTPIKFADLKNGEPDKLTLKIVTLGHYCQENNLDYYKAMEHIRTLISGLKKTHICFEMNALPILMTFLMSEIVYNNQETDETPKILTYFPLNLGTKKKEENNKDNKKENNIQNEKNELFRKNWITNTKEFEYFKGKEIILKRNSIRNKLENYYILKDELKLDEFKKEDKNKNKKSDFGRDTAYLDEDYKSFFQKNKIKGIILENCLFINFKNLELKSEEVIKRLENKINPTFKNFFDENIKYKIDMKTLKELIFNLNGINDFAIIMKIYNIFEEKRKEFELSDNEIQYFSDYADFFTNLKQLFLLINGKITIIINNIIELKELYCLIHLSFECWSSKTYKEKETKVPKEIEIKIPRDWINKKIEKYFVKEYNEDNKFAYTIFNYYYESEEEKKFFGGLKDNKADKKFKIDEIKTFDDIKFEIEYNYDDPWKIIFE